jgi:hypothetical protein
MKFIEMNEKIINLGNVATIIFNSKKKSIIFNFSNSINILGKETSDFYIENFNNTYDYNKMKTKILNLDYIKENFLIHKNQPEIINKSHINSITSESKKIIFNLDFGVDVIDYKTNELIKISKFVYWRFNDENEMYDTFKNVKKELLG